MELEVGQNAPEFSLSDQKGDKHSLKDYKGRWVLLYFYPRDNTPGCTKEACAIRDSYPDFEKLNIKVFGVSTDSVERHEKFASKFELPFTLLSDHEKKTVEDYNVWRLKKMAGREYFGILRMSFLIDPNGKIAKIYPKVKPAEHAAQVLDDLQELMK
jgi:thioredoxin-dependent peroxiredoxin